MLHRSDWFEFNFACLLLQTRGPVPGPLLRPGLLPLVPQLSLLRAPHHSHPAVRGRGVAGGLVSHGVLVGAIVVASVAAFVVSAVGSACCPP